VNPLKAKIYSKEYNTVNSTHKPDEKGHSKKSFL